MFWMRNMLMTSYRLALLNRRNNDNSRMTLFRLALLPRQNNENSTETLQNIIYWVYFEREVREWHYTDWTKY